MRALHLPTSGEPWPRGMPDLVLGEARALQSAARAGGPRPLLRGRHLGLMCRDADLAAAALFREAACELGARVSQVVPIHLDVDPAEAVGDTARLLGRLYDAVECQGLAAPVVSDLRARAGIPVFAGVATDEHPSALLVARLDGAGADRRRYVLQAVLIVSLS